MATVEQSKTCKTCGQPNAAFEHCERCFWKVAGSPRHAGFRAINAILGDESNLRRALDAVGGLIELQELISDLSAKGDEWDAGILLKDAGCEWLEGAF